MRIALQIDDIIDYAEMPEALAGVARIVPILDRLDNDRRRAAIVHTLPDGFELLIEAERLLKSFRVSVATYSNARRARPEIGRLLAETRAAFPEGTT